MAENLFNKAHKDNQNKNWQDNYERVFGCDKIKVKLCLPDGVKTVWYPRGGFSHVDGKGDAGEG